MRREFIWEVKARNTPLLKKNAIIAIVTGFIAARNSERTLKKRTLIYG